MFIFFRGIFFDAKDFSLVFKKNTVVEISDTFAFFIFFLGKSNQRRKNASELFFFFFYADSRPQENRK